MARKLRTTTPLATAAATSRVPYANLETIVLTRQGLEAVQKAIAAGMVGGKKPRLAEVQTALNAVIN